MNGQLKAGLGRGWKHALSCSCFDIDVRGYLWCMKCDSKGSHVIDRTGGVYKPLFSAAQSASSFSIFI